jgi:hypothetical protein
MPSEHLLALTASRCASRESHQHPASPATRFEPGFAPAFEQVATSTQPAGIPEPESTAPDSFNQSEAAENSFEECAGITRGGEPCRASPRKGARFCIFHDPAYREIQRSNSAAGGRASARARVQKAEDLQPYHITDPAERRYLIGLLLEGQFTGKVPPARARSILSTLDALARLEGRSAASAQLLELFRP